MPAFNLTNKQFDQLFTLFYGMICIMGVQDQELVEIYNKLELDAKQHYGDDFVNVIAAMNDEYSILNPN